MNLLPQSVKQQIRREYLLRFSALLSIFVFFALGASFIVATPFVIPMASDYFAARQASKDAKNYEQSEEDKKILSEFQSFKDMLIVLDPRKTTDSTTLSGLIALVVKEKPDLVSLTGFFLVPETSGKKFEISGVAANRESLVVFSRRLSSEKTFASVELPISNLSKKTDIEFSIVATITDKKESTDAKDSSAGDKIEN